ncbi:MAG: hypothetical protein JO025_00595 [Verrucomicrobia bacterium]|nr:hypothetical protein [Verrucomicrobiota bacterium]
MKWSNPTAQGFSPGLADLAEVPLKVASEIQRGSENQHGNTLDVRLGRHFQGVLLTM